MYNLKAILKKIKSFYLVSKESHSLEKNQIEKSISSSNSTDAWLQELVSDISRLAPQNAKYLLERLRDGLAETTAEAVKYQIAESLSNAVYPKFKFSEYGRLFLEDEDFLAYYQKFMDPGNWHSLDRKYTLDQFLSLAAHLPGDMVECGCYKGATAYLLCRACSGGGHMVHLFDSFEGLSEPGPHDGDYWQKNSLTSSVQTLRDTLAGFENFIVYQGWIPERFDDVAEIRFCFLHVDVDLYQPTLDTLEFFYGRMVDGGVFLFDDYGFNSCPGAKKAIDEFFGDKPERVIMLTTGQAFAIKLCEAAI